MTPDERDVLNQVKLHATSDYGSGHLIGTLANRLETAIAQRAALVAACEAAQLIVNAHLCPFGMALKNDSCECNHHAAAKQLRAALALAKGETKR